ncbi:MAG: hypothetical protein U0S36_15300 [Candidatus Nanopelagicales bacterium]
MGRWLRREAPVVLAAMLSVVVLGPSLAPGYTLIGDQVFVPDQSLLPWMLGLGGGLPRSVPQDAVVAVLTGPVPGWVWESVALVSALVLLGAGVARLLRAAGTATRCVGVAVAVWSPYVAERLLIGHWSLLLAVAVLPWALVAADGVRRGRARSAPVWLLWTALASLTPTGGLLVVAVSAPVLLWSSAVPRGRRVLVALGGLVLQLPWLVPSLQHPAASGAAGADVFALRPEGPWGALLTALGTGGLWNADAVPGSRATLLAPLATLGLVVLAVLGRRAVVEVLGRPVALTLVAASAVGLAVALLGSWELTRPATRWVVEVVPGGGLVRDGQKWLAPWLVLLAVASALGARRVARAVARRAGDASLRRLVLAAVLAVPLLTLPDLAWGALGRLASVDYPDDWQRARDVLAADPAPGDVVSLPWSTFRRFPWNDGRTVLDPAPRAMPRTVVTDTSLVVRRGGALVVVPGDDPRSTAVGEAVRSGADLGPVLREQGVGWALVAEVGAPVTPPAGATRVLDGRDLDLYRLAEPGPAPALPPIAPVVAADSAALVLVLVAGVAAVRRRPGHDSDTDMPGDSVAGATRW